MTTPVCTIDATGIHKPTFAECLAYYQEQYRGVYGADVILDNDTQDGQWIALQAAALDDANSMAVAVYNAFSPVTAQGTGLSSVVKINGISRGVSTYSQVDVTLVGQAGSVISNGVVSDINGNLWNLPASVTIPYTGEIKVTAIAQKPGQIPAEPGTVTTIATPQVGWQTVTNPTAASPGSPVEGDTALKARQTLSTALPSQAITDGITGALAAIPGVTRYTVHENETDIPDSDGVPAHCLCFVIEGGDQQTIADTIYRKKPQGVQTYGSTLAYALDSIGTPRPIYFYRPTYVPITWHITIKPLGGYTTAIGNSVIQSVVDWTNAADLAAGLFYSRAFLPANLNGSPASKTYEIQSLAFARDTNTPAAADIVIALNEAAYSNVSLVTLTVVI